MDRMVKYVLVALLIVAFGATLAMAGERVGRQPGVGRQRQPGAGGGAPRDMADRMKRLQDARLAQMPMVGSEKAKAEDQRYRTELEPLLKTAEELRNKVKKEVDDGAKLEDAVKNHLEESKALAKKVLEAYATHMQNLSAILKEEGDGAVDKLAEGLLKEPERPAMGGPKRQGDAPKEGAPKKEGQKKAGDNPFTE